MIKDILQQNESVHANDEQLSALREHFPACFKQNGSFDLERFKETIADKTNIIQEGYELKFLGKSYAEAEEFALSVYRKYVLKIPDANARNITQNELSLYLASAQGNTDKGQEEGVE